VLERRSDDRCGGISDELWDKLVDYWPSTMVDVVETVVFGETTFCYDCFGGWSTRVRYTCKMKQILLAAYVERSEIAVSNGGSMNLTKKNAHTSFSEQWHQ